MRPGLILPWIVRVHPIKGEPDWSLGGLVVAAIVAVLLVTAVVLLVMTFVELWRGR